MVQNPDEKRTKVAAIYRQAEFRINQSHPEVSPLWVKSLKTRAMALAKQTMRSPVPFTLVVDFSRSGQGRSVFDDPSSYIAAQSSQPTGCNLVLTIDRDGGELARMVDRWDDALNWEDLWAAKISEEQEAIVIHIYGPTVSIFDMGTPVERVVDVCRPKYPFAQRSNRYGYADEYAMMIRQHFEDRIQYERAVKYWGDRRNRKFVGAPEEIFQRDLRWYLDEYLLDHRNVTMEFCADGLTDRTDIWVETIKDEHYVFEIKWLGQTITRVNYDEARAREGARQTIEYLRRIPRIKRAALILYDGRSQDEDIQWTGAEQDPKLDLSLRLFIQSLTASQIARQDAR